MAGRQLIHSEFSTADFDITGSRLVKMDDGQWFVELHSHSAGLALRVKERLFHKQSRFQRIEIFDTNEYGRLLALDGLIMLTERDESAYHEMLVHPPMLCHSNPQSILIVGGGDGGTLREVVRHSTVKRVVQVEIDGDVVEVCKKYFPTVATAYDHPALELVIDDAIDFVEKVSEQFDVIIIDSSDPVGPAVGLIETDFYRNVHRALKSGGILTVQIGSPFYDLDRVKLISNRLKVFFQSVSLYLTHIPCYPSGLWSIGFAANNEEILKKFDEVRYSTISSQLKYYNNQVHWGAFLLPEYIKRVLQGD